MNTLYRENLPSDYAKAIIKWARENKIHINLYIDDRLFVEEDNDIIKYYTSDKFIDYTVCSFDELEIENVNKILAIDLKDAGKITLTGATEYQRFRKVTLNIFEETADYDDEVATMNPNKVQAADPIALVKFGKNAFGTYSQIIKDLRLPTAANYQWSAIRQVETPIVGAIYNQYIIEYHAPANSHPLSVVGGRLNSYTTHVFWVKNDADLVSAWETALKKVGTIIDSDTNTEVSSVETHAESELTKGVKTVKG